MDTNKKGNEMDKGERTIDTDYGSITISWGWSRNGGAGWTHDKSTSSFKTIKDCKRDYTNRMKRTCKCCGYILRTYNEIKDVKSGSGSCPKCDVKWAA